MKTLGVVILAAGRSRRMGRPKMLLPWAGTSILGHHVSQWDALSAGEIGVVFGQQDAGVRSELDRLSASGARIRHRIPNPLPDLGMYESIRCASRWTEWGAELRSWALVLGDQPQVSRDVLRTLLTRVVETPERIWQPSVLGKARHPVVLPRSVFHELATSEEATLKEFLGKRAAQVELVEVGDPALNLDIDTEADYVAARRWENERGPDGAM